MHYTEKLHKNFYRRGYLPHRDIEGSYQFITFHLADSIPQEKLNQLLERLKDEPPSERVLKRRYWLEELAHNGYGECFLRRQSLANIVIEQLLAGRTTKYGLLDWVVMPNHFHALIHLNRLYPMDRIIKEWKGITTAEICKILNRPIQAIWQYDYWDEQVNPGKSIAAIHKYIQNNPVKANLVEQANQWPFSQCYLPSEYRAKYVIWD